MSSASPINLTQPVPDRHAGHGGRDLRRRVVYLCEHSDKGALGLVINKPIDIKLRNLFEKVELTLDRDDLAEAAGVSSAARCRPSAVSCCTRSRRDDGANVQLVAVDPRRRLEMTTSKDVLEALSTGAGPRKVLVTLGYAGWGAGQLEDEIGRNSWLTVDADPT